MLNQSYGQIQVSELSYEIDHSVLLQQVSYTFETGKIHTILGQNGAGKSTLLSCLSHEIRPSQGTIEWNGQLLNNYAYAELASQRAVLSQSIELAFSFSVQELVELGEEVQQRPPKQALIVVETVLEICDLKHLRDRDYLTLSGGEQKRTQLARVLAQIWPVNSESKSLEKDNAEMTQPIFSGQWLFLDEWTAGLDIKHQQRLGRYFKQWVKQGLGIIMVLHDLSFAAQLADCCLILKAGEVFADGDVCDTLTQSTLEAAMEISVRVERDRKTNRPIIYPLLESF